MIFPNMVQSDQNHLETPQKKNHSGTTPLSLKAGLALGSNIPTSIFPASSFK